MAAGMMMVFCTFPDVQKARAVGSAMVEGGYAACVNLLPGVESVYEWKGEVQSENEVLAIFKVKAESYELLEKQLLVVHPYDTPEVVGITADKAEHRYLRWLRATGD